MRDRKGLTAADRPDTWDPDWESRLSTHVGASVWDWVRRQPGLTYHDLAEALSAAGGFGVAPIQVERLQVRDTPEPELRSSLRDSLVRHLRAAFHSLRWGEGPYWESRALGALVSWSAMWSARVDLSAHKHRLFAVRPPLGWVPEHERDRHVLAAVPD